MTRVTDAEARAAILEIRGLPPSEARRRLDRFVRLYSRLIHKVAMTTAADLDMDDKVQCGRIGFMKAAHRFRLDSSTPFDTYASWVAKREIQRTGRDLGRRVVRVPASMQARSWRVARAARSLAHASGTTPSLASVAAACDLSERQVQAAIDSRQGITSLDVPIRSSEGAKAKRVDLMPSDFYFVLGADRVRDATSGLAARHQEAVRLLYFEERSCEETGAMMGVSRQRAHQILGDAHVALRLALTRKLSVAEKREIRDLAARAGLVQETRV